MKRKSYHLEVSMNDTLLMHVEQASGYIRELRSKGQKIDKGRMIEVAPVVLS